MNVEFKQIDGEKVIHFPAGVIPFGDMNPDFSPFKKYVIDHMTENGCDVPFSMMKLFEIDGGGKRKIHNRKDHFRTFGREVNVEYVSGITGKVSHEKTVVVIGENEINQDLINRFFEV